MPSFLRSTQSISGRTGQASPKTIELVALLQLIVTPTSQEAEGRGFTGLLAGPRHVPFKFQVPEPLEDSVIINEGPNQTIAIRREHRGNTISLSGAVQKGPLGVWFRLVWFHWTPICFCKVQDVGFMVQHQSRAALVASIDIVDAISCQERKAVRTCGAYSKSPD